MKKTLMRVVCILLSLVLMAGLTFTAFAVTIDYSESGIKYSLNRDNNTAMVVGHEEGISGDVSVPSVVKYAGAEYSVILIAAYAFMDCDEIKSITVNEGVIEIDAKAFADCSSLRDVYLPDTLTVCAVTAFDGCADLTVHAYRGLSNIAAIASMSNITLEYVDSPANAKAFFQGLYLLLVNFFKRVSEFFKSNLFPA